MFDIYFYVVDPGAVSVMYPVWELARKNGMNIGWIAEGYAAKYFHKQDINFVTDVNKFIRQSKGKEKLLFGSQTNFGRTVRLIREANKKKIRTYFLFDHWCNYEKHFKIGDGFEFPSGYIMVMNELAGSEVRKMGVPADKVKIVGHPGIEKTIELYKSFEATGKTKKQILFLSEPIEKDLGYDKSKKSVLGYTEYSILNFFLSEILVLHGKFSNCSIIIKPHPRENVNKIEKQIVSYKNNLNIKIGNINSPVQLIFQSEYVIGITTVLLLYAMAIGKKVASIQVNRNMRGKECSNIYLESILVKDRQDLIKMFGERYNYNYDFHLPKNSADRILSILFGYGDHI